jgi:hypothetical protein
LTCQEGAGCQCDAHRCQHRIGWRPYKAVHPEAPDGVAADGHWVAGEEYGIRGLGHSEQRLEESPPRQWISSARVEAGGATAWPVGGEWCTAAWRRAEAAEMAMWKISALAMCYRGDKTKACWAVRH